MKQPCQKDCPQRKPGCGTDCPDWAAYVRERDKEYKQREQRCKINDAAAEGYRRCGAKHGQY